jgi:hypothetical protein
MSSEFDDGYNEGYDAGCDDGEKVAEREKAALLTALQSCLSDLEAANPKCVRLNAYRAAIKKQEAA